MKAISLRRKRATAALILAPVLVLAATTTCIATAASESSQTARLSSSARVLGYGQRLGLDGRVPADHPTKVKVKFRPAGSHGWSLVKTVHSDSHGVYRAHARAHRNGAYRVVGGVGRPSAPQKIRVRARTSFHLGKHFVIAGHGVLLKGRVHPGGRRRVKVVIRGSGVDIVRDVSSHNGRFRLRWKPTGSGNYRLRTYVGRNHLARGAHSVARRITAFRYAGASWYGSALYGNHTACGELFGPDTMGVANKTLPCGTMVTLRYHGNQATVPVIDRGPYVAGREYDLSYATKEKLGFVDVGDVLTNR